VSAGPSSGADRVRIQAQTTSKHELHSGLSIIGRAGGFEFGERTPHFDRGRRRMRSKSLAMDRHNSSLENLLRLKVRRQHSDVARSGLCFGRIKAGCERGRARRASRRQDMLSAYRVQRWRDRRHGRARETETRERNDSLAL
jgi:hypothetical protein